MITKNKWLLFVLLFAALSAEVVGSQPSDEGQSGITERGQVPLSLSEGIQPPSLGEAVEKLLQQRASAESARIIAIATGEPAKSLKILEQARVPLPRPSEILRGLLSLPRMNSCDETFSISTAGNGVRFVLEGECPGNN